MSSLENSQDSREGLQDPASPSTEADPAPVEKATQRLGAVVLVLNLNLVIGLGAMALGFAAIGLAWYHAGNTDQVWVQMQELISGGAGGLGFVIVGTGFLIRDQMARRPVHVSAEDVEQAMARVMSAYVANGGEPSLKGGGSGPVTRPSSPSTRRR